MIRASQTVKPMLCFGSTTDLWGPCNKSRNNTIREHKTLCLKRARCLALFREPGLLRDGLPILRREPMVAILTTKNRLFSLDHLLDIAFSNQTCHQQARPHPFLRPRESYTPMAPSDFPSFKIRTQGITDVLTHSEAIE